MAGYATRLDCEPKSRPSRVCGMSRTRRLNSTLGYARCTSDPRPGHRGMDRPYTGPMRTAEERAAYLREHGIE